MITPYMFIGMYMINEWRVYSLIKEVADWVEQQPKEMWERMESTTHNIISYKYPYAVSPELHAWMELKWG